MLQIEPRLIFAVIIFGFIAFLIPMTRWAWAASDFCGDANLDEEIDVADVVTLVIIENSEQSLSPQTQIYADANRDGTVDESDQQYVVDVILGIEKPLAIVDPPTAIVSYWLQENESALVQQDNVLPAVASYWFQQSASSSADENNAMPQAASYWYMMAIPEATEVDARQMGTPSYDRQ